MVYRIFAPFSSIYSCSPPSSRGCTADASAGAGSSSTAMSTGSCGGCERLVLPGYLEIIDRNSGEQQRQNACKRLETGSRNGYDDPQRLQQHPCIIWISAAALYAFFVRLVNDLLHHKADAGKVADGYQRADDAAQQHPVVKGYPAHQMQRCKHHPHHGGAQRHAAGDAQQLLFWIPAAIS